MDILNVNGKLFENPAFRKAVCRHSLMLFAMVYFRRMFKFKIPEFHKLWYALLNFRDPETRERFRYLVLCGFRESAKTSLAKIKIVHDICYRRKKLIGYVCYEKESSGEALFDIVTWLTTNQRLIADFGNLFDGDDLEKRPEKKTIGNFVTTNGVRVRAYSIRQTARGKVFDFDRPDCFVLDDFENLITKGSAALTKKAISFMKEMMTGLSADAEVIFICNKVSDTGSVQWLLDSAQGNSEFRVQEVPVEIDGKSVWPEMFVMTDQEAKEINKTISNPSQLVRSLESMRRTLNSDGQPLYEQEMLLQPIVQGDRFFDIQKIDARIAVLKAKKWQNLAITAKDYKAVKGDWTVWGAMSKVNQMGIAADVSEGAGGDSSVIQIYDFKRGKHIAEFESDSCPPDVLAMLMAEKGKEGGFCVICPERNSVGVSVVYELKRWGQTGYPNIYREKTLDKINDRPVYKFGWHTNSQTKPHMLYELKRDFEAGLVEINSIPLLREMRSFTKSNLPYTNHDPEASNHFDRVMAFAIVWQMRNVIQIKGFQT